MEALVVVSTLIVLGASLLVIGIFYSPRSDSAPAPREEESDVSPWQRDDRAA